MTSLPRLFLSSLVLVVPAIAQGPDILIPSGSLDGAYALVDRDMDGRYTTDGEAYDYILAGFDTSPRNYVAVGTKIFFPDPAKDQIVWVEDGNKNGFIEPSERHVFFDAGVAFSACDPISLTLDYNGWLWWTNNSGTAEGIYRSKDLNNDGDAEDANETIAVLVEPATVVIANAPKSTTTNLAVTGLDSIHFDASWGANGRFLCEEENFDQTLAFEDKNNDGDFNDAGECYIFCALWNGGTLAADVNPDVPSKIPAGTEMLHFAYDGPMKTYYLLSADTNASSHPEDHGLIYRGIDKNSDGDINDADEVTVFLDVSLNSTGNVKGYNFLYGMTLYAGWLYVSGEFDATVDEEHLLRVLDINKDGDANDPGEAIVVWSLPRDRTHYQPAVFPAGTFPPPAGLPGYYAYYGSATCATSLTGLHNIQGGSTNWDDKAVLGNSSFKVRTWGCAPTAPGINMVGIAKIDIPLDASGTCRLVQTADVFLLPFVTDTLGAFNVPLPIPNAPSLIGARTLWQSLVLDAAAPAMLGFTISDAFEMRLGTYSYSIE